MRYALNESLTFFFCSLYTEDGEIKTQPSGVKKIFGCVKHVGSTLDIPLTSGGKMAHAPVRKALKERFDITIRTEFFDNTLDKILWQNKWLIPLSEPQPLGIRTGYSSIKTILLETLSS